MPNDKQPAAAAKENEPTWTVEELRPEVWVTLASERKAEIRAAIRRDVEAGR